MRSESGFEVGAALVELLAGHGDRVEKGPVLARLHSAEQEVRAARAKARVISEEAAISVADAGGTRIARSNIP